MKLSELLSMEVKSVFTSSALMLTIFGGVIFYSILYPLPYKKQVVREQKITIVDLDNSQTSRKFARMLDATPQIKIVHRAASIHEAKEIMLRKKLAGIVVIPKHFYKDLLMNKRPTIAYGGDASYFLVYGTILQGLTATEETMTAQVKVKRLLNSNQPLQQAKTSYTSLRLEAHPLFNETNGYVNYVIPAIFVLILHQTMLMAMGILAGSQKEQMVADKNHYLRQARPMSLLLIRSLIFIGIYSLLSLYYYGPAFHFYDIPQRASISSLTLLNIIFLLATAFLGVIIGSIIGKKESAVILILISSMPIVFGSGFIWPTTEIPILVQLPLQFIPAVPAIKAFVLLNQAGADLQQIKPLITHLTMLAVLYGVIAYLFLTKWLDAKKEHSAPAQ